MKSESNGDKTTYYYVNNKRYELFKDPSIHAVRFKSSGLSESRSLSDQSRRFLREGSERIAVIPNYELHVYQTNPRHIVEGNTANADTRSLGEDVASDLKSLNDDKEVDFVSPAYRQTRKSPDVMFVTKRFTVRFKPDIGKKQIDDINSRYGVKIMKKIGYTEDAYLLEAPSADGENGPVALANIYYESGLALWANPDLIKQRHLRRAHTEVIQGNRSSYISRQWHLKTAKVMQAWKITQGSPDIAICIMDDGVETLHHEFNNKILKQYDFSLNVADGNPKNYSDRHGTSCAGVATAAGIRAYGAAPKCSLISICTPVNLGVQDEAEMFVWAADNGAHVISCSWGPRDGVDEIVPLPDITREAIHYCVIHGRGGKGIPIFWAAGNGNVANPGELVDNDGYASNPDVMAIAASTNPDTNRRESKAPYSDTGKALFVSAPSSGGSKSIFTADRRGSAGYNPEYGVVDTAGEYTDAFGGTSSATPLVAGIAALMLSVNPNLSIDEVRDIIRRTADKIGDRSTYHSDPGSGISHSELFGYGRVNAAKAVREAQQRLVRVDDRDLTDNKIETISEKIKPAKLVGVIPTLISLNRQDESLWLTDTASTRKKAKLISKKGFKKKK